jgi:uncharacterized membrane protein YeaQ/YmgE (transglycosylase-associated protein family)
MSGTLIDLIIQIIAGVVGGHAAGATLKNYTFGVIGNTIAGAIGGVVGGQLLQQVVPALANVDIGALIGQRRRRWRRYPNRPRWCDEMDSGASAVDLTMRPSS